MEQAVEQVRLISTNPPSLQEAWEMAVSQLRMEMSRSDFSTWVEPLRPLSFKEGVFRIGAVNEYTRDWVQSRLRRTLTRLLESILRQQVSVRLVLISHQQDAQDDLPDAAEAVQRTGETGAEAASAPLKPASNGTESGPAKNGNGKKKSLPPAEQPAEPGEGGSPRKIQLQRAYGTERARIIQPERAMFLTMYFFENWLPLLGHSAAATVMAARSMCYWNPMTGVLRNVVEIEMQELADKASVSLRTVKDVLRNELVKKYFLRYKVRRIPTVNGVRTAGITLIVRMDDPLTPEDQAQHNLPEEEYWYTTDFEDEKE